MQLDPRHPANARIVDYFRTLAPRARPLTPWREAQDPYYEAGAHPDVVEFLWDRLGASLPTTSRCLLFGVPVLVQPDSGIILAVAMGTGYALRVPDEELTSALANGYRVTWDLRTQVLDAAALFGADWIWGRYGNREARWMRTLFERFSATASSGHEWLTPASPAAAPHGRGTLVLTVAEGPDMAPREVATNPDAAMVERAVRSLSWKVMTMVTLERGDDSITAGGSLRAEDGLSVSYVEDGEEHVSVVAPRNLDVVVALLRAYAEGREDWRTIMEWE